ncbi:cysteine proteinase [Tothia fuscella]|uniref:Cysteine proteinase n=1 Tax=Tothia fuscella TaxID=1048955 RepID=A0A9P4NDL8_9PEZI|nr:cysteine proteinase [Tothia fuscella]
MKGPIDSTPEPGGGDNDDDRDAMDPFDLNLHPDHLNRLRNNEMLDDRLIAHLLRCFSVAANSWAIVDSLHLLQMPPPDKLKALYASKETLFIPVHHQNAAAHWSCLVVTNPNISPVAHHYDSCPNPSHSAAARDYVTDIFDVLQPRRLQPRRMVIFRDVNSARQRNGVDCGIFVLVNAIYLLLGLQPPATDVDSNLWRRVFAAMLCSKDQQHMSDLSEAIKRRSPVAGVQDAQQVL